MNLRDVIATCQQGNPSVHIVNSSVRKGQSKPGTVLPDAITSAFAEASESSGVQFGNNSLAIHEIRRLVSRLYAVENKDEFARKLLGHKHMSMTKKYLDSRGQAYEMVQSDDCVFGHNAVNFGRKQIFQCISIG